MPTALTTVERTTSPTSGILTSGPPSSAPVSSSGAVVSSGGPAGSTAPQSAAPVDPAALATQMQTANSSINSLLGAISIDAGSTKIAGTFTETVSSGRVSAIDMTLTATVDGQDVAVRVRVVNGQVYVGGAAIMSALDAGTKTWALARGSSGNATLRALAGQLNQYVDTAGAAQYTLYVKSARSITDQGTTEFNGATVHQYLLSVDVADLAAMSSGTARSSLETALSSGIKTIPATLWLDSSYRVVRSTSDLTAGGVATHTDFQVTGYNTGVTIKAPIAENIYTG